MMEISAKRAPELPVESSWERKQLPTFLVENKSQVHFRHIRALAATDMTLALRPQKSAHPHEAFKRAAREPPRHKGTKRNES